MLASGTPQLQRQLQDTTSRQDTQPSAARQSFHQSGKPRAISCQVSPPFSLPGYIFSREGQHRSWRKAQQGPVLAWRAQCLTETQLRQMVPCSFGWELRQGTGPRAGAPRHTKTRTAPRHLLQLTKPGTSLWCQRRLESGSHQERGRADAQGHYKFHALRGAQPRPRTDNKRSSSLLHRPRTTISPTPEPKPVAGNKQPCSPQASLALEGRTLSPSPAFDTRTRRF